MSLADSPNLAAGIEFVLRVTHDAGLLRTAWGSLCRCSPEQVAAMEQSEEHALP